MQQRGERTWEREILLREGPSSSGGDASLLGRKRSLFIEILSLFRIVGNFGKYALIPDR
jgi:hypothetical protein